MTPNECACGRIPAQETYDQRRGLLGQFECKCGRWVDPKRDWDVVQGAIVTPRDIFEVPAGLYVVLFPRDEMLFFKPYNGSGDGQVKGYSPLGNSWAEHTLNKAWPCRRLDVTVSRSRDELVANIQTRKW